MPHSQFKGFKTTKELDQELSGLLAENINSSIKKVGYSSIALSGGQSPLSIYRILSGKKIDWSNVYCSLVDERCVELDHKDSNERSILSALSISNEAFKKFYSFKYNRKGGDITLLDNTLESPKPFQFVLLGMGMDGHFASIFPKLDNLSELLDISGSHDISLIKCDNKIPYRVTLTLKSILETKEIILLIKGQEKLNFLKKTLNSDEYSEDQRPIKKLFTQNLVPVKVYYSIQS